MAKNQPSKKGATGKRANGGSSKKKLTATPKGSQSPRKVSNIPVSKTEINLKRLKRDEAYAKKARNDKANKRIAKYKPILSPGTKMPEHIRGYITETGGSRITREEYAALDESRYSLPNYLPIRDATTGKLKGYYNEVSGERVSEYYYRNVFRKRFVKEGSEREKALYDKSLLQRKVKGSARVEDLARTYKWVHPDMSRNEIMRDPTFRELVKKANYWTAMQNSFTPDYVNNIDMVLSEALSLEEVKTDQLTTALKLKVGSEEEYMEVMKALGRKLPDDNTPIDSSPEAYLAAVYAYYMALNNGTEYEGEDEEADE
jgi:hypothetical protein